MTERIQRLRTFFVEKKAHHEKRSPLPDPFALAEEFQRGNVPACDRAAARLCRVLDQERPLIFPDQTILFVRSQEGCPELYTEQEKEQIAAACRLHERGEVSNISVDYSRFLTRGIPGMRKWVSERQTVFRLCKKDDTAHYADLQLSILDSMEQLMDRYRAEAERMGLHESAEILENLRKRPPETLREALQLQRIVHFTMWCSGSYHNTLGRFDQYMLPFFESDMQKGTLTEDSALELLEEYFLSFNIDSDRYPGMQQGDNGQSMVLGGVRPDGTNGYTLLSELCLKASLEMRLIDPKINLRVDSRTPLSVYCLGTRLTKQGLGFPQYSNDDVVIPGLVALGYRLEDARDYVTAACWEFIIPGKGMEVPNIDALCFPQIVRQTVIDQLQSCASFEDLMEQVKKGIVTEAQTLMERTRGLYLYPAPFLSLMMEGCVEKGRDVSEGCVYNNYGFHGAGLSTAADSLAAIQRYVYDTKQVSSQELLDAMDKDFEGYDRLLHQLRYEAPKMGNNEPLPDEIACRLLTFFSQALEGKTNDRGGCFRAGTGSAMYYLWASAKLGATPDGRRAGEGFSANYSPSLFIHAKGPVSIIQSFTKPDLTKTVNGGPLTLELHDTLFRDEDSMEKVAKMVKSFIDLGGHQLQLNAVNRETMLDAQKYPEKYRNLIVRVWGWSGYFVELDKAYQDHIIQRMELSV